MGGPAESARTTAGVPIKESTTKRRSTKNSRIKGRKPSTEFKNITQVEQIDETVISNFQKAIDE